MEILTWWTTTATAKALGISPWTVRAQIARGRLRAVQTPLGALVDPASIEQYARTRRPVRHKGEKVTAVA
jgi:hypothetical protein